MTAILLYPKIVYTGLKQKNIFFDSYVTEGSNSSKILKGNGALVFHIIKSL